MTTSVNYYRIASDCYSSNTCHVGGSLCSCRADTDGVAFGSNTGVADICIVDGLCVVIERTKADRRVVEAGCKAEKRIITLSSVVIRIAAAWCGKNRSSCWRKRKPSECERDKDQGGG